MSEKMVEWPEKPPIYHEPGVLDDEKGDPSCSVCHEYERARADAAMARLIKLRKACIRFMASDIANKHKDYGCVDAIAEALEAIGELPDA